MQDGSPDILIADDIEDNFVALSALIRDIRPEARIHRAKRAATCLSKARELVPDLILLDILLPDSNGYEVCSSLKEQAVTRDVPVVLLTAMHEDNAGRVRALECGAEALLNTPVDRVELESVMTTMFKLSKALRAQHDEHMVLKDLVDERTQELRGAHIETLNLLEKLHRENDARKRSEEYFRRVSSITSDVAYSCEHVESRYQLRWITGAAERITGYTADELKEHGCWRFLVVPEDTPIFDHKIISLDPGVKDVCELRIVNKRGEIVWLESSAECTMDQVEGHERRILYGGLTDVSERHRVQEALRAAKNRAEHADRLKDAFVANISHEIRTPLNIILGYADIIAEKFLPMASASDLNSFESIKRGGERLMRTVDMIIDISRLQSGEFIPAKAELDLLPLLRRVILDHQEAAKQKSLVLSLADECGDITLWADEYSLTQAIRNLVHNAIKFTDEGRVELRLFRDSEGRVCVSVSDSGIGIAQEYLSLLFSRYSQEHVGFTRPYEGLGLGLALVKEYVTINGATIDVISEKGIGSTFTITFMHAGNETQRAASRAAVPVSALR